MTKEEVLEAANVMIAYANGKKIGTRPRRSTEPLLGILYVPTWNWEQKDYRVIPESTIRPWKFDEVPVGSLIRYREEASNDMVSTMIIGVSLRDGNIKIGIWDGDTSTSYLLKFADHSIDGGKTWKPCGVEESK
jgi:hypothetical protein